MSLKETTDAPPRVSVADPVATAPAPRPARRQRILPSYWPAWVALALILAGGLYVRLLGIRHGLPWIYHPDEAYHFASLSMSMFNDDLDPGYLQNPSAFTYIVYLALLLQHGGDPPAHLASGFFTARIVATVLCMGGVAATYAVGRRLWGAAEGVAAAAVLSFAFLPVAYSRYAVTDVGVLLPVAVALYGAVKVAEDGRLRYYLLTGVAVGGSIGFKYTAGLVIVPFLVAAFPRARRDRRALGHLAAGLALAVVAFAITTPYFFINLDSALDQLQAQREAAATPKLGQEASNAFGYYPRSLTWALGWVPVAAVVGGFVVELRRARRRAVLLALFPVLLTLYLSLDAGRYFARWLMPVYPALALFAGVGLAYAAARLGRGRAVVAAAALGVLLIVAVAQPIVDDVRNGRVLAREDTRQTARDFLFANVRPSSRVVVDPDIPRYFFRGRFVLGFGAPPKTPVNQFGTPTRYINDLSPARLDRYRRAGYCTVVTLGGIKDRATLNGVGPALAYYAALAKQSRLLFADSPYRRGQRPLPFDFDLTTHLYYPREFERPGPTVAVYRLNGCKQGYGPPGTVA